MESNFMEYKGYKATIDYDKNDKIMVGAVIRINAFLSFHGKSIDELKLSFQNCIDDYLEMCSSIGREPEKSNGNLL